MSDLEFLGFSFTPVLLEHQGFIEEYFKKYPQTLSRYTFVNLLGWSQVYRFHWVILDGNTLLIAVYREDLGQYHLLQPVGNFFPAAQQQLLENISHWEYPIHIYEVTDEFIQMYPEFCAHFTDVEDRSRANYLYKTKDLALLEGRNYEKKRNLISQANRIYDWVANPLDVSTSDCSKLLMTIGNKNDANKGLQRELMVLNSVLTNFERLHLTGYMIGVDGAPVAFSVVNILNPTTKIIIFEKADTQFKGLFQVINKETSKAIMEDGYEFINREEDLGVEGLRKAKKSYHPIKMVASHILTFIK